jgi:hypothetical protein
MGRNLVAAILALMGLVMFEFPALAECGVCSECDGVEDAAVCGCPGAASGEVGVRSLQANVGESVAIPVWIGTTGPIAALGLDVEFPADMLQFDTAIRGNLTEDFQIFGANEHPNGGLVRLGAFAGEIPAGVTGELAVLQFTVVGAGCETICVAELFDDLESYDACSSEPPASMAITFDVMPGRCPNRLMGFGASTFQAAILGTNELDVSTIANVQLSEEGGSEMVEPLSATIRVVDDPAETGCDCAPLAKDGISDLVMTFDKRAVLAALRPNTGGWRNKHTLRISGMTDTGVAVQGTDCVRVLEQRTEQVGERLFPESRAYVLSASDHVRITLHDVSGRLIEILIDGHRSAGTHRLDLEPEKRASGVYFVRLESSEAVISRKVVIVH